MIATENNFSLIGNDNLPKTNKTRYETKIKIAKFLIFIFLRLSLSEDIISKKAN